MTFIDDFVSLVMPDNDSVTNSVDMLQHENTKGLVIETPAAGLVACDLIIEVSSDNSTWKKPRDGSQTACPYSNADSVPTGGTDAIIMPAEYAVGGWTVALAKAYIDANLASATGTPEKILINLGANDVAALPAEATWKANLTSILNSLRAKWPAVNIHIAYPWRQGEDTDCNTLAGWIDAVIATYPSGVYVGIDERVTIKAGDDGATNTTDGIHYSDAGQIAAANAWLAVL